MFELNQTHLSCNAEVIPVNYSDSGEFNQTIKLCDVDLTFKSTIKQNDLMDIEVTLDQKKIGNNGFDNVYNLTLKNPNYFSKNMHVQMKPNSSHKLFEDIPDGSEEEQEFEYIMFASEWCQRDDMKNYYFTFHFWKQDESENEKKSIEFTDCIINAKDASQNPDDLGFFNIYPQEKLFRANISILVKSSQIIYNMIKDLDQNFCPKKPVDLTRFFSGFSCRNVHMYLCCLYNPHFQFYLLLDILEVLKIAIKLDNQNVIQRIMDLETLDQIVDEQLETFWVNSDDPNYVDNVLDFAKQHNFQNLVAACELKQLKDKEE